jgi:hypothetical protein
MKNQDERLTPQTEADFLNLEDLDEGEIPRPPALPFSIPLLPLSSTSSAVFARSWTKPMLSALLRVQLTQVSLAVAGSVQVNTEDSFTSDECIALLFLLVLGKLGSSVHLSGRLSRASAGRAEIPLPLSEKRLERETNKAP